MKVLEVLDDPIPEEQGIFSSPKGFYGPGIIANLSSKLQKMVGHPSPESPQQNYNRVVPPLETIADIAGGFVAPGKTFLQRILSAGAVPAAISGLGGKGLSDMALQGGLGAATQGILEPIMGAIKQPFMKRAANQLMAGHGQQVAGQEFKEATDQAMLSALETLDKAGYKSEVSSIRSKAAEDLRKMRIDYKKSSQATLGKYENDVAAQAAKQTQLVNDHAGQAALKIMEDAKSKVPAWSELTSDVAGVADLVAGKGQQLLSDKFDEAMKAITQLGEGKLIRLPVDDIKKLGVPLAGIEDPLKPGGVLLGRADAAQVAEAVTGRGGKDPRLYRRVVNALDAEGVGDPVARAEYKAGQGFIQFLDKTKAITLDEVGNPVLNTQKILAGLTPIKVVDELRRRELGDVFNGPFMAAKGGPPTPPEIAKPSIAPFEKPPAPKLPEPPAPRGPLNPSVDIPAPDIGSVKLPGRTASASIGAGATGALGYFGGMGLHPGAAITGTGALLGALRPDELITRVPGPLGNQIEQSASGLAQGGGGMLRELLSGLFNPAPPMENAE